MSEWTVVRPDSGCYSVLRRSELLNHEKRHGKKKQHKCILLREGRRSEKAKYCALQLWGFLERETAASEGSVAAGRWGRRSPEGSQGSETALRDIVATDARPPHLSKPGEYTPGASPV